MGPHENETLAKNVRPTVRDACYFFFFFNDTATTEIYTDVYADEWGPYLGTTPPPMLGEGPGPGPTKPPQPA